MSNDGESFLARWSKRKAEARTREPELATPSAPAPPAPAPQGGVPAAAAQTDDGAGEVALEDLPPIETIDAATDLTPWLKKKVPEAWKQAALRRAWAADPAISQFTGLADYDWDWNAPDGVPGFGPLRAADDVVQLLAQAIGHGPAKEEVVEEHRATALSESRPSSETPQSPVQPEELGQTAPPLPSDESRMPQNEAGMPPAEAESTRAPEPMRRRRGGGALPS